MANVVEIVIFAKDITGGTFKKLGKGFKTIAKGAAIAGTALAGLSAITIKAFASFESAFAGVRKTVEGSEKDFAILAAGIRQMSQEIPESVENIARIAETAGQLGIAKENILGFTRTMVDLGNATNIVGEEGAKQLARLANITRLPQSEFDRLGSTIVELGNNLATTEGEIVAMSLRLAGAGTQIGLTEDQILSFSGALSSVGIRAELGGSAFSRVMIEIANSVAEGGKELDRFAKISGQSTQEFKKAFETDAAGALITFIEGLDRTAQSGENVFGVLEELGFADIRVRDTLLRAAGASALFRESLEIGSKAWEKNTALTEEANKRYATLTSQFKITLNVLKDISITFGAKLAPAVTKALKSIQGFAKVFANVFLNLPQIIDLTINLMKTLFIKFFTDFSFFQTFLQNFAILATTLLQSWGNILIEMAAISLKIASIIFIPLGEAFSVLGSNIRFGWQILINNLAEVMVKGALAIVDKMNSILNQRFQIDTSGLKGILAEIENEVIKPAKSMEEAFDEGGATILGVLSSIGDNAATIGDNMTGVFETLKEAGTDLAGSSEIQDFFGNVQELIADTQEQVVSFGDTAGEAIKKGLTGGEVGAIGEVGPSFEQLFENFQKAKTEQDEFKNNWMELNTAILENTTDLTEAMTAGWTNYFLSMKSGLQLITELSIQTWEAFSQGVGDAIANAIVFGEDLGKAFSKLLKTLVKNVISALIQIGIQRLAQALIAKAIGAQEAVSRMATLSAETFAGAFASTVVIPVIGPALAPGVAAASSAAMLAGAAGAATAGAATGLAIGQADDGIANVPRRGTFVLDTNERVLSANQNKDFTDFMNNEQGGGSQIVVEQLNIMPDATIDEALLSKDSSFFLEFAELLLPQLNVLGDNGATTTLGQRETGL